MRQDTKTLKLSGVSVDAMAIMIDHTIVPSKDKKESAEFYARIFGFEDIWRTTEGGSSPCAC